MNQDLTYFGPMPWYLRVEELFGELWSELRIFSVIHHTDAALWAWTALSIVCVLIVGLGILARKH